MAEGLLPHTQTAMIAMHDVAYHDFEGIATELEERERLVADMGAKNAMILRNHGTLTVGESVAQAFLRMYYLERLRGAGPDAERRPGRTEHPAPGRGRKVEMQSGAAGEEARRTARLAGPLRKLDRIDPSFRN